MTEPSADVRSARDSLRRFVLVAAGVQTAFWLYTFRFIGVNANPMGDGMEWLAVFPFGLVFLGLVVPALVLAAIGRLPRLSAALASAGFVLNLVVFAQVIGEFTSHPAHLLKF